MLKKLLVLTVAMTLCRTCSAQIFSGPSAFSLTPVSQLGTVTNLLTLTDTPTGFIVSGQVIVSVPASAGAIQGVLAAWAVDRPLNPTFGTATLTTTTVLSGFSAPPPIAGNSTGFVTTVFTNPGATASQSFIPMNLVGGIDAPPWLSLSATSPTFSYTSTGVNSMQQRFVLNGLYLGGAGGNWTIDVPVFSVFTPVPEPTSVMFAAFAAAGLVMGYRRVRKSA